MSRCSAPTRPHGRAPPARRPDRGRRLDDRSTAPAAVRARSRWPATSPTARSTRASTRTARSPRASSTNGRSGRRSTPPPSRPDGSIVAGGDFYDNGDGTGVGRFGTALVRYAPDGSVDTGFGAGGKATFDSPAPSGRSSIQPDGRIVTAGVDVARYLGGASRGRHRAGAHRRTRRTSRAGRPCPAGAVVTFATPTAIDAVDGPMPVTCTPPSGATFPVGVTSVVCSATDAAGNTGDPRAPRSRSACSTPQRR